MNFFTCKLRDSLTHEQFLPARIAPFALLWNLCHVYHMSRMTRTPRQRRHGCQAEPRREQKVDSSLSTSDSWSVDSAPAVTKFEGYFQGSVRLPYMIQYLLVKIPDVVLHVLSVGGMKQRKGIAVAKCHLFTTTSTRCVCGGQFDEEYANRQLEKCRQHISHSL